MNRPVNLETVQEIVDRSPEAILLCDNTGLIVHANESCLDFFGYHHSDLVGHSVEMLLPAEFRERHRGLIQHYINKPKKMAMVSRNDIQGLAKNGESLPIKISLVPIDTQDSRFVIATIHNLVTLKEAEKKLRRLNRDLEQRVAERTLALEQMNQQLLVAKDSAESANTAKTYFLANTSHELRTPLTTIIGTASYLSNREDLSNDIKKAVTTISESSNHLLDIISDLLDLSKLETANHTMSIASFDLHELLSSIQTSFEQQLHNSGLSLTINVNDGIPQRVSSEKRLIRQVLTNLITNAIKFTSQGGITVDIHAKAASEPSKVRLVVAVQDTGCGIEKHQLTEIFKPYVQVGEQDGAQQGAGLGLYISKKYAQLLGGDIKVDSQVDQGSTFILCIKVNIVAEREAPEEISADIKKVLRLSDGYQDIRVAIAEDNTVNSLILERILEGVGLQVRKVFNGRDIVELRKTWKPNLIWMDIQMPIMDGLEATKRIRAWEGQNNLNSSVIIALTANAYKHDIDEALSAGCDAFATKPYDEFQLFSLMKEKLGLQYVYASA